MKNCQIFMNKMHRHTGPIRWLVVVPIMLLSACAAVAPENRSKTDFGSESRTVNYLYRTQQSFVRIEKIEAGAPANGHPASVSVEALQQALAGMRVAGASSLDAKPLFTQEEIAEIATPLATALAEANADQDVTFGVSASRGFLGSLSTPSFTTGRVFVRDGRVNIVLGLVHELYATGALGVSERQPWTPGSRARRIESGWEISPGNNGRATEDRGDWVTFDLNALAPAPAKASDTGGSAVPQAPSVAPVPGPVDPGHRATEMANRLRVLEELKRNGTISDDEYRERRRAILQEI